MDRNVIPEGAADLCARLRAAGHEACLVGGCVRDLLLGRTPGDWDVATSAMPEEVAALFDRTIPTGVRHGTVTVLMGELAVEVTTFRREGGYADGRHPDAVAFDAGLMEDLGRRDFTINAMALDGEGEIVDPYGGRDDLADRLIRCVSDPARRFTEDALRMLRAMRFSAQLGFAIEEQTLAALRRQAGRTKALSAERVRVEVEKTLLAPWPERGEGLFLWGLLDPWLDGAADVDLTVLHRVEETPLARWAVLCALLGERGSITNTGDFLRRLRLDKKTVAACEGAIALAREHFPQTGGAWREALARRGEAACYAAACMGDALTGGAYLAQLRDILKDAPPLRPADLAVTGGDLLALGYTGLEIGKAQERMLRAVLERPGDNERETLLKLLREES